MTDFDEASLARWMQGMVPSAAPLRSVEKFAGGQSNPTYRLHTTAGGYVLRRKPFGKLLPSAHAVEREFRLISAIHPVGFPVPRPVALCEDETVIGAVFYLMEMVEGRTFWNGTLPEIAKADRRAFYGAMIDKAAALHSIDPYAVGLGDFGRPGNYMQRQVERWTKQYRASQTDDIPEVEKLIEWLPCTVPEQAGVSIIHGDYRIDNLIYAQDGPQVRAVLDWELATIGDPLADFAYLAMHWVMPRDNPAGLSGVDLAEAGIPTLDEAVARYCGATGRDSLPDLHWYFAFNVFRLVGIVQGIKKRVIDGNASSSQATEAVERLLPLARVGWAQARIAGATE
ncbi:phosphotransferase family protein [Caballeronia sordidicola]|uniref:Putative aminoglycoside phosphotransferase n=1 Tax=Caballeronia sordidicola TaxID=196367 RepID=A0A242N5U2_CABSO|nr:phosphotransferase family protein [Caballeronia sordidicola]OTP79028.1 putative aminoglycoside phosphotransferase [Caballeronia sordidicola]